MCCWYKYKEANYFLQQLRLLLLLLLLPLRKETSKSYSNQKGLKRSHLSALTKLHKVFFFCFIDYRSSKRNVQYFATRIGSIILIVNAIYIYKKFCPSKIGSTWSYLFSVNLILTQQACTWTNGELSKFYDPITSHQDQKSQCDWWVKFNQHLKPET